VDNEETYDNINLNPGEIVTCTFTNEYTDPLYTIEGYVWNDANRNGVWDDGEDPLEGWELNAVSGKSDYQDLSDENGYYSFSVPAGTWTIFETVQNEWAQTYPEGGTYEVAVGPVTFNLLDWLVPTAHAVYFSYNFGNVFVGCTENCGEPILGCTDFEANNYNPEATQDDESCAYSSGGGGGGSVQYTPTSSGSVQGEVLGAQIEVLPVGAPNAGVGAAAAQAGVMSGGLLTILLGFGSILLGLRRQEI